MKSEQVVQSIPDSKALACVPESLARDQMWLAFHFDGALKRLRIGCRKRPGSLLIRQVELSLMVQVGNDADWCIEWTESLCPEKLVNSIDKAYSSSWNLDALSRAFLTHEEADKPTLEDEQSPVANWFDALLVDAVHRRATDIHIQLNGEAINICFRVDGELIHRLYASRTIWRHLVARIKVLSSLDVTEQRMPQDGSFSSTVHGKELPVRVAVIPHGSSEKITLRLMPCVSSLPSLETIFVLSAQCQTVQQVLARTQGLVLVAGATGSGKTTTLYACLSYWQMSGANILTLEDPIEVDIPGICQSEVNSDIGYTFSKGLRAALRHDPDGLMVGEIRDESTCELTMRASITGHPVLATVHANDAMGVFHRLLALGASWEDLQECVQLVIVQRLARKPCACATQTKVTKILCTLCNGCGYYGRVAVVELFAPNERFFSMPVAERQHMGQRLKVQYNNTLTQLQQGQFIDENELARLTVITGGTDAKVLCASH